MSVAEAEQWEGSMMVASEHCQGPRAPGVRGPGDTQAASESFQAGLISSNLKR